MRLCDGTGEALARGDRTNPAATFSPAASRRMRQRRRHARDKTWRACLPKLARDGPVVTGPTPGLKHERRLLRRFNSPSCALNYQRELAQRPSRSAPAKENTVIKMRTISLLGNAFALALMGTAAQAAPARLLEPVPQRLLQQAQSWHSHHHHHGHVHGNPHRRHLDCSRHGDHEHCQVHAPRHRRHDGHVHGNPHGRHLDCRVHGHHEHCRVHNPRRWW